MSARSHAVAVAGMLLLTACLGPTGRPVTAPVPEGTTVRIHAERDTLLLRWIAPAASDSSVACATQRVEGVLDHQSADTLWMRRIDYAETVRRTGDVACHRRGAAIVIAPAASVTIEELVPVSPPVQIGGSVLFIAVVAGVSLLIFNAADGLFGIVGRWF